MLPRYANGGGTAPCPHELAGLLAILTLFGSELAEYDVANEFTATRVLSTYSRSPLVELQVWTMWYQTDDVDKTGPNTAWAIPVQTWATRELLTAKPRNGMHQWKPAVPFSTKTRVPTNESGRSQREIEKGLFTTPSPVRPRISKDEVLKLNEIAAERWPDDV